MVAVASFQRGFSLGGIEGISETGGFSKRAASPISLGKINRRRRFGLVGVSRQPEMFPDRQRIMFRQPEQQHGMGRERHGQGNGQADITPFHI